MAFFLALLAGGFVALSNLCMRKSIDSGGTAKGYLVFMMMASFLCSVLLEPVRSGNYAWNPAVALLGAVAGVILAFMLASLGKALEMGPPGLTFSLLSGSTVMPAILMSALFGSSFGFPYTPWHAIGSILVIGGIFWAGKGAIGFQDKKRWILFAAAMFCLHIALLVLFQWRSLLLNFPRPEEVTRWVTVDTIKSIWFLSFMFLTSWIVQLYIFATSAKRWPRMREALFGVLGGTVNGTGTFFLVCAIGAASPLENAIIFPMYSVAIIVLSNIWGQKIYQEKVNWKACQVCAIGLMIGTVDWKGIVSAILSLE